MLVVDCTCTVFCSIYICVSLVMYVVFCCSMAEMCKCAGTQPCANESSDDVVYEYVYVCVHCTCEFLLACDFVVHLQDVHERREADVTMWRVSAMQPFKSLFYCAYCHFHVHQANKLLAHVSVQHQDILGRMFSMLHKVFNVSNVAPLSSALASQLSGVVSASALVAAHSSSGNVLQTPQGHIPSSSTQEGDSPPVVYIVGRATNSLDVCCEDSWRVDCSKSL